jgi:MFS superfamily sulfate permease-like transporter
MTKVPRNKPEDESFFSRHHMTGFMAMIAVCAVVATAEVFFGGAEPGPGDLAWSQPAPAATGQGNQDAPAIAAR